MNLPRFVQIEPVGQCNLKCRMCPVVYREEKPPAFMSFEAFCSLVDQFSAVIGRDFEAKAPTGTATTSGAESAP